MSKYGSMSYRRRNPVDEESRDLLRRARATRDPQLAFQAYVLAVRNGQLPDLTHAQAPTVQVPTPYGNLYVIPHSATEIQISNAAPGTAYSAPGDTFVVNRISLQIDRRYALVPERSYGEAELIWRRQDAVYGNGIYRTDRQRYQKQNISAAISEIVSDLCEQLLRSYIGSHQAGSMAAEAIAASQQIAKKLDEIESLTTKILEKQGEVGLEYLRMVEAQGKGDFENRKGLENHEFVGKRAGWNVKGPVSPKEKCLVCGKTANSHTLRGN